MYLCQWHLDLVYGKLSQALEVLQMWGKEKMVSSEFRRARQTRLLVGHVGVSPSHVTDEYVFETLADFEAALAGMTQPQFSGALRRPGAAGRPWLAALDRSSDSFVGDPTHFL